MQLIFPAYKFKTKTKDNVNYVFDIIRKKYVVFTPEEWVRQHVVHYLIEERQYPMSLIAVERGLSVNGRKKRFDIMAFNKNGQPLLLIECKSPEVQLSQQVFDQIALYNSAFGVRQLFITNGLQQVLVKYNEQFDQHEFLGGIPVFDQ